MTMLIAIPTGVKIFNWIATMWGGRDVGSPSPMKFAIALIAMFTIGGISGVMHSSAAGRPAADRHLLHRRALPLRALRWVDHGHLRGHLPLLPEDDRPLHERRARQRALLADLASA
jgi:hypothetical protein